MQSSALTGWIFSSLFLSLRVSPVFALAPPFSLTRVPAPFRAFFGVAIAACIAAADPTMAPIKDFGAGALVVTAARELMLGGIFVMAFQLMFGALYMAGRTIDIQAGYGLALLIDPATQAQTPLVGTIFAYAAGAVFFAMGGHAELLKILAASVHAIPLGAAGPPLSLDRLTSFMSVVFLTAFGVGGGAILSLFLADIGIAALARTAPQMNALVLGFQVKTLLLLTILPLTLGFAGALLARLAAYTLQSLPGLL